jgi:hypothetical protein
LVAGVAFCVSRLALASVPVSFLPWAVPGSVLASVLVSFPVLALVWTARRGRLLSAPASVQTVRREEPRAWVRAVLPGELRVWARAAPSVLEAELPALQRDAPPA